MTEAAVTDDPGSDGAAPWLSDLRPTVSQKSAAVTVGAATLAAFIAVVPFSAQPLGALNIFFPLLDAIVLVTDLVTAILLFSQFAISGSRPLLALGCGYFFTGLIVIPHALTFTGAFSPTGLLGANIQTGSWLFIFWHLGFAIALLAYALLARTGRQTPLLPEQARARILWSMTITIALVCALTWLATGGTYLLPQVILDSSRISPLVVYPIWLTIFITAAAFVTLAFGRRSVLDLWLMVLGFVFIGEMALSGLLPSVRFSLGFYAGRGFSIIVSTILLVVLLSETTRLYTALARSHANLRRERDNKLMNFEAIVTAIGHEIKQPLTAIELNSSTARRLIDQSPAKISELHAIIDETKDAARHINETLVGFRSLFGQVDQKRQPVNINDVVLEVLKLAQTELNDHEIMTRIRLSASLPTVRGNENQIHQLIYNLVHNAIEAMAETTDRSNVLEVKTSVRDGDEVVLEILDNGPGIAPERLDYVFEPFVTTKPHGMGLGLAICRQIVERHGGQLSAAAVKPTGTSFRVSLHSNADERRGAVAP